MEYSQVLEDSMVIKLNAIVFFWQSRSVPKEIYLQNFSYIINRIRDVWVMGTAKMQPYMSSSLARRCRRCGKGFCSYFKKHRNVVDPVLEHT